MALTAIPADRDLWAAPASPPQGARRSRRLGTQVRGNPDQPDPRVAGRDAWGGAGLARPGAPRAPRPEAQKPRTACQPHCEADRPSEGSAAPGLVPAVHQTGPTGLGSGCRPAHQAYQAGPTRSGPPGPRGAGPAQAFGSASIMGWAALECTTSILRGLASSATGIVSVSTPSV